MIPKTIHYCWFGGRPLDEKAVKCLESWKCFFPDYEIKCWNEENFEFNQMDFMKKAYSKGKWAFVSDVARLIIIYQNGGIYFDTDVEVIASYNDILLDSPKGFLGLEVTNYVNTGLGFAAEKGNPFLLEVINRYREIDFLDYIDSLQDIACPIVMTDLMKKQGFIIADKPQSFRGMNVYPTSYFSPLDYDTGRLRITKTTHSIHWGNASWNTEDARKMRSAMQFFNRLFGKKTGEKLFGIYSCVKREGIISYAKRHI